MRNPSELVVPTERCGLRRVGACHQSRRRRPPPPRLAGVKPVLFDWPWATPGSWADIGAVRPRPTIVCTNERRETRPALTCSSSLRISGSSIGETSVTTQGPDLSSALSPDHQFAEHLPGLLDVGAQEPASPLASRSVRPRS